MHQSLAARYLTFARDEAAGRSPLYETFSRGVAGDDDVLPLLALLEVGAAAGLCLLPDHYAYEYEGHRLAPATDDARPCFSCHVDAATPLPQNLPEIVW